MASKSAHDGLSTTPEDIGEMLDVLDKTLDRLKVMYEQYFLGIQKQAPAYLHTDVERKLRDLTQISIRNTGLRYRFATVQQKFGSYNSYWRRTLRQIENGTYGRNLSKIGREAARSGEAIPEEILAAMPKRMREQVIRDREQAIATNARRKAAKGEALSEEELRTLPSEHASPPERPPAPEDDVIAMISEPTDLRRDLKTRSGAHVIDDSDDLDIDSFFASIEQKDPEPAVATAPPRPAPPAVSPTTRQPGTPPANPAAARPTDVRGQPDPVRPPGAPVMPSAQPAAARQTGPVRPVSPPASPAGARQTGPIGVVSPVAPNPAAARQTGPIGVVSPATPNPAGARQTGPVRVVPPGSPGGANPRAPVPPVRVGSPDAGNPPSPVVSAPPQAQPGVSPPRVMPTPAAGTGVIAKAPAPVGPKAAGEAVPAAAAKPLPSITTPLPKLPPLGGPKAPSQAVRPNPIAPGAAEARGDVAVESMSGPFPRTPSAEPPRPAAAPVPRPASAEPPRPAAAPVPRPTPRPAAQPRPDPGPPQRPPPGMTDADVNALYAKYVKAKEAVGETVGPGGHAKLLKTINAQAPKIMEQYKAKAVDFSVVVKDNQVIIRAKPKA